MPSPSPIDTSFAEVIADRETSSSSATTRGAILVSSHSENGIAQGVHVVPSASRTRAHAGAPYIRNGAERVEGNVEKTRKVVVCLDNRLRVAPDICQT